MTTNRIMVIRHGEKPSADGSIVGVDCSGAANPDELSVLGWQRAGALVGFFAEANGVRRPGIYKPDFLFAPGTTQKVTSVRAAHTLAPLAGFIGTTMSTRFTKGEEPALVRTATALPGTILVAWEHRAIVDIANALMGRNDRTPQAWPDDRFDLVWVFERNESNWRFSQVPQLLLPGDSAKPI
jgi:hypothetical protein